MTTTVRLSRDEARDVFRTMLAVTGRPGRWSPLPAGPSVEPVLLPVLALADLDTVVHVIGRDERDGVGALIAGSTGARVTGEVEAADMVVALEPPDADHVARLRTGSAAAPERGARLFVATGLGERVDIVVTGPGCTDGRPLALAGIGAGALEALAAANAQFPAGVDAWFVSPDGQIAAVPRSSTITFAGGSR